MTLKVQNSFRENLCGSAAKNFFMNFAGYELLFAIKNFQCIITKTDTAFCQGKKSQLFSSAAREKYP
jgi:hypothetical protein